MAQEQPGPTEELATLYSPYGLAPHSDYQIDLAGPMRVKFGNSKKKVWILIACQTLLKRVLLAPVESLTTTHLVQSLLTLSAREGSISFVHSDPASNVWPLATRSTFLEGHNDDTFTPEQQTAATTGVAWPLLCSDEASRLLKEKHCTFRISFPKRSHVQQEAEGIVNEVKKYLSMKTQVLPENVTILQFAYILEKAAQFLNERPLFTDGRSVISANTIVLAAGRCGPVYPWSGLYGMANVNDDPTDRF